MSELPHAYAIGQLQQSAQLIPVERRKGWLKSEAFKDYQGDLESLLHARAGTPFDEARGVYKRPAYRGVQVSKKPPKGTRQVIIEAVSKACGLSSGVVDNLWQTYRRFERELKRESEMNEQVRLLHQWCIEQRGEAQKALELYDRGSMVFRADNVDITAEMKASLQKIIADMTALIEQIEAAAEVSPGPANH